MTMEWTVGNVIIRYCVWFIF